MKIQSKRKDAVNSAKEVYNVATTSSRVVILARKQSELSEKKKKKPVGVVYISCSSIISI